MIILTFEEYDKLMEEAEDMDIPEDYDYPSVQDIKQILLTDENYLVTALAMSFYPKDDAYYDELNALLKDMVYLTDDEKDKKRAPKEFNGKIVLSINDLSKITDIVKSMSFQCTNWYPTIYDFKSHILQARKEDIAFLLWVINAPTDLNKEEIQAKEYAQKLLKEKLTIL